MILAELVGGMEDGRRIEIDCPRRSIYVTDPAFTMRINVLEVRELAEVDLEIPVLEYRLCDCRGGVHYYQLHRG